MTRTDLFMPLLTVPVLALILTACAQPRHDKGESELLTPIPSYGAAPLIRVKLAKPSEASSVTVDAGKATLNLDGKRVDVDGPVSFSLVSGRIDAGAHGGAASVEISPTEQPSHFNVDGRIYRGKLRLVAAGASWDVVNVVDLEQYVAGVVGWEMIAGWPVEALKAQAIASRTYAIFEMEHSRGSGRNWDVDDTTRYQVYGGVGPKDNPKQWRETANVLEAREGTSGEVLTYQGQGFRAFFHSTSGGHTVSPDVGLGIDEGIAPLGGVDLGDFDKDSPKANWEIRMDETEVKARFIENSISPSDVIRIEGDKVASSGHAETLKLYDRTGHHRVVNAIKIRQTLGLFSTNFSAEKVGNEWVFTGKGYGHGCGMCQWSARGMAKAGWDANRILETMYPGAAIKRIY